MKKYNLKSVVTFIETHKYNVDIETDEEIYIRFNTKR